MPRYVTLVRILVTIQSGRVHISVYNACSARTGCGGRCNTDLVFVCTLANAVAIPARVAKPRGQILTGTVLILTHSSQYFICTVYSVQ